jgi:hypothetical protein
VTTVIAPITITVTTQASKETAMKGQWKALMTSLLAVGFVGNAVAYEDVSAARAAHFQEVKRFARETVTARIQVLEGERRCIDGATTPMALKQCHEGAKEERELLKRTSQPRFEHLKMGAKP